MCVICNNANSPNFHRCRLEIILYLMSMVAPLAAAVVAGLAARLAVWGPLGGSGGLHAEKGLACGLGVLFDL